MSCIVCKEKILNSHQFIELSCNRHMSHLQHKVYECPHEGCIRQAIVDRMGSNMSGSSSPPSSSSRHDHGHSMAMHMFTGGKPTTAPQEVTLTTPASERRKAMAAERAKEPLRRPAPGIASRLLGGLTSVLSRIRSTPKTEEDDDPFALLAARVPLKDVLVDQKGFDITNLINDYGVTVTDFFDNGYTMREMCDAFGSRMNHRDGIDVLRLIGVDSEHFRVRPDWMDTPLLQERIGYRSDLLYEFGYQFQPGAWTMQEMIAAGLTMQDVMNMGMNTRSEWEQLCYRCTSQQLAAFKYDALLEADLEEDRPEFMVNAACNDDDAAAAPLSPHPGQHQKHQQQVPYIARPTPVSVSGHGGRAPVSSKVEASVVSRVPFPPPSVTVAATGPTLAIVRPEPRLKPRPQRFKY